MTSLPIFLSLFLSEDTKIILRISCKPKLNFFRHLFWIFALKKIYKITFPTLETLNYFKKLNVVDESKLKLLYDPVIHTKHLSKVKKEKFLH